MATFLADLWSSIFTAGPTPTLLVATNAAFAILQTLLAGLFIATYSVHFAVLSFLCGGLWIAINWFANEVRAMQAQEEEKKRRAEAASNKDGSGDAVGGTLDSGDDTETELDAGKASLRASGVRAAPTVPSNTTVTAGASSGASVAPQLASPAADESIRKRRSLAESTGDISTDSEWEKVDEE